MGKKSKRTKAGRERASGQARPTRSVSIEQLEGIQHLWEQGRALEAMSEAERLLERHPRDAQIHLLLGQMYGRWGREVEALEHLDTAARLAPFEPEIDFLRVLLYASMGMNAHALRMARRYLASDVEIQHAAEARRAVREYEELMAEWAARLDVSAKRMEQGAFLMEEGRWANSRQDLAYGLRSSQEASRMVPKWPVPRNNAALAQFYLGKTEQAIALEEGVLAELDPDNVMALGNLVHFHAVLGQMDKAESYADRLAKIRPSSYDERLKMAEAFTALKRDQAVYDVLVEAKAPDAKAAGDREWTLAIALANMKRMAAAKSHLRRANVEGDAFRQGVAALIREGLPGPGGRYPYYSAAQDLPPGAVDCLRKELKGGKSSSADRLRALVKEYPGLLGLAAEVMWFAGDDEAAEGGINLLKAFGGEEAGDILRSYATGRVGSDETRAYAAMALAELEPGVLEQPITVVRKDRPIKVRIRRIAVVGGRQSPYSPEIGRLLDQALEAQRKGLEEKAEQLYQQVLAKNPKVREALGNLGALYLKQGNERKGVEYLRKALEADPMYVTARVNLSTVALADGRLEEAKRWLDPLADVDEFQTDELVRYLVATARLALVEGRYEDAENHVNMALKLDPDNEWALSTKQDLTFASMMHDLGELGRKHCRRQTERRRRKPIDPQDALDALLSRYPKDTLAGIALELSVGSISRLKKDQLVSAVRDRLLDVDAVLGLLRTLKTEELTALRHVVEAGGVVSLRGFVDRYGDDAEESSYWYWHTPETILGRLKVRGLLFEGTYRGEVVLVVPKELMALGPGMPALLDQVAAD
ncbi:MAG: tetratricopeptide repeat protein [Chloroflexota bacterium]